MNFREATEAILKGHVLSYQGSIVTEIDIKPNITYETYGNIWLRMQNGKIISISSLDKNMPQLEIANNAIKRAEHPVEEMRITLND